MRRIYCVCVVFSILLLARLAAYGADRFVIKDHPDGDGEFLSWETAAPNIQSAIDVADAGDTIWVAPGTYDSGTKAGSDSTPNRVAIDIAVTVRSSEGPGNTFIQGERDISSEHGTGASAVRGVEMVDGAKLIGFTVTDGATLNTTAASGWGGGIKALGGQEGVMISNCVVTANVANRYGAGMYVVNARVYITTIKANLAHGRGPGGVYDGDSSEFYDCIITFNTNLTSLGGGGVCFGTYYDCEISNNQAVYGGPGALSATLHRCTITNNVSPGYPGVNYNGAIADSIAYDCLIAYNHITGGANRQGGGAQNSTLYRCQLIGNSSGQGGGAYSSTLYDCLVKENEATYGGGVSHSTVYNSKIIWNKSSNRGGGARESTLYNTLIIGNEGSYNIAGEAGGGAYGCDLFNCTVVGNRRTGSANRTVGGVSDSTVINSIVIDNECDTYPNYGTAVIFTNSLTYPKQDGWAEGNITNAPRFIEWGSGYGTDHIPGDYHLQSHSPGMNAGIEFNWMTEPQFEGDIRHLDRDGNPRIGKAGVVDMGAYEYVYTQGTIFTFY